MARRGREAQRLRALGDGHGGGAHGVRAACKPEYKERGARNASRQRALRQAGGKSNPGLTWVEQWLDESCSEANSKKPGRFYGGEGMRGAEWGPAVLQVPDSDAPVCDGPEFSEAKTLA